MTSQPEDKIAAILQQAYNQTYQESFGTQPPRGGQNSPSSHPEVRGTRRLEEGWVDSRDIEGEEDTHREHGDRTGAGRREESLKMAGGQTEEVPIELIEKQEEEREAGGDDGPPIISDSIAGLENVTSTIPPTTTTTTSTHTLGTTDEGQDPQSPQRPGNQDQDREKNEDTEEGFIMPGSYPEPECQPESSAELYSDEDEDEDPAEDEDAEGEADSEPESEGEYEYGSDDGRTTVSSLEDIAALISQDSVKNIIVLAGAGISTSAGIPDFRSPETGLYANLKRFDLPVPEAIFDIGFFREKPEPFYVLCKDLYPGKHLPTPTHYFFRLLQEKGKLLRIFTQNIDTLERIAGIPSDKIVEAHGSFATSHCISCHAEMGEEEMRRAVETGGGKPVRCERCGGLVKPDIVFFGEGLPERFFELAVKDLPKCDLLIVVGTSLKVHPFASLVERVPRTCPRLLINREAVGEATGWGDRGFSFREGSRDRFFQGDADAGARELARGLGWQDELNQMIETQQRELRIRWSLDQSTLESSAQTAVVPEDTIDKLAKELEQAGL